mmetsp:Transcript_46682/g.108973  ORF Transcript_46682/g.108973 Transcript_46682/m.108973 type:complete len:501 (+) Transcript_46682:7-1509(+)
MAPISSPNSSNIPAWSREGSRSGSLPGRPSRMQRSPSSLAAQTMDDMMHLARQATGLEQYHTAFERLPDDPDLAGPLPPIPPERLDPRPVTRLGSLLLHERRVARTAILKASPVLHYTESWFETLFTLAEYVPPTVFWFVAVSVSLVTWAAIEYPDPTSADDRIHNTMIGFISLLIVFRTSQAYARWWEGRTLWGAIVNSTRNLASNAVCWMLEPSRYTHVIICTIAFAYATKQNLRGKKFDLAEMHGLFQDDEVELMNQVEHIPLLMIDEIRRSLKAELMDQGPRGSQMATSYSWDLVVSNDIKALVDALGGCERIAKTPMPFGYLAQLRMFILLWLISWPFALTSEYGWGTIPLVLIAAFFMLKIEEMAVQIEHPFGTGANDLPIDTICVTIERNLLEILRRAEYLRVRSAPTDSGGATHTDPSLANGQYSNEQPLARLVPPHSQPSSTQLSALNTTSSGQRGGAPAFATPAPSARSFLTALGMGGGESGSRRARNSR